MIVSASRRTDIPAFYAEWFFNRLKEGYVLVRNLYNYRQVSKISLSPEAVDCFVFWTKNPTKILEKLDLLKDYKYYFLITITPYDNLIEKNLPPKDFIIQSFQKLFEMIGKNRTIWRYDPIFLADKIDIDYHRREFDKMSSLLAGYAERCVISFLDLYPKIQKNAQRLKIAPPNTEQILELSEILSGIAGKKGIKLQTCCESVDLTMFGIERGKCVDDKLIEEIAGKKLSLSKDKNQRQNCGCALSVDIGAYDSCRHDCVYCYANISEKAADRNIKNHDPYSPLLIGRPEPEDVITERPIRTFKAK